MKKTVRLLALLAIAMLCVAMTGMALADTVASGDCGVNGSNLTWTLDSAGTLTISGTGAMKASPSFTLYHREKIKNVVINSGATNVANGAFSRCANLTSVTIPSSVTSIGTQAFYNCTSLPGMTIPSSVTSIGNNAFYGCSSLTSLTLPSSVTSLGDWAFYNCTSLTSVTLPSGLTSIGKDLFYGCTSLTNVTIPSGVTSIGDWAFYNCSSLTSVTIPSGVTSIGMYAYSGCSSLTSAVIPASVTSIGTGAFRKSSVLTIYGVPGSTAESYANSNGIPFANSSSAPNPPAAPTPLKAVALHANATTARVGDVLTFTTQFEGDGEIAWIEYHIYDTYGNHLTGYRGEGAGISGVYNYPTVNTGAGKYTARVYLMAKDGTFTQVDSVQVTVTGGTRKAVALNPNSTSARVGDVLTFTTQFEGDGPIAWIEYHIYDMYGNHLTGYRGEGAGISGVYNYPTVNTGAGRYTARVYLMAQDGTFTYVDSAPVTVSQ